MLPVLGRIPAAWKMTTLASVLEGGTRNGVYKPKQYHGTGARIVNMGELFAHPRLRAIGMKRIELTYDELRRFEIRPGDLLFARRSLVAEGAGRCTLVCEVSEPTVFESSIIRARPNPHFVDSRYLFYLFRSPYGDYALDTIRRQVAVAGITGRDLTGLMLPIPPIEEQRSIADTLSALDDKIELNRLMSRTLESIVRAIFRSWFVDFDPVLKTMNGGEVDLPPDVAGLFPKTMEDSRIGAVPAGWPVAAIGDAVKVLGGSTPSTREPSFWGGDICFATPRDMAQLTAPALLSTERRITPLGAATISSGLLPVGAVLMSSRAPVGYLAITEVPVCVNQGFIAMLCEPRLPALYVLNWARENMNAIVANANGTTFLEISKRNFRPLPILLPPRAVADAFGEVVSPLHQRIVGALRENASLSRLRDQLLPRLLNGSLSSNRAPYD